MPELRRRSPADADAVVGWVVDADALYLFTGAQLRWPLRLDDLLAMDHVPGFAAWVLVDEVGMPPLGHVDLTMVGTTVKLGRVIIDPHRRGEGLAHVLIDRALLQAGRQGATRVRLNVIRGNEPALRTYRRAGFREAVASPRVDVVPMELQLRAVSTAELHPALSGSPTARRPVRPRRRPPSCAAPPRG